MYRTFLTLAALAALTPCVAAAKSGTAPIIVTPLVQEVRVSLVGKDMSAIKRDVHEAAVVVCSDAQIWPESSSYQARGGCMRGSYDQAMTQVRLRGVRGATYATRDWIRVAAIDLRTLR